MRVTTSTLSVMADTIASLQQQLSLLQADSNNNNKSNSRETFLIHFSKEELRKMPSDIKKKYRIEGFTVHARLRTKGNSRYEKSFEIRFNKCGYHISASGKTEKEVKENFISKLRDWDRCGGRPTQNLSQFEVFADYWFNNFHKRKVKPDTCQRNYGIFKRHILPDLQGRKLKSIFPPVLQSIIDSLTDQGKGKTADEVFSILNQIFDCAVKHGLITINPMGMIFHQEHERVNGKALTIAEEKHLLDYFKGSPLLIYFAVGLYAGLRPNEFYNVDDGKGGKLTSITIKDNMLVVINSKRKNGKIEYKRIPICSMLAPYLKGVTSIKEPPNHIPEYFRRALPEHRLYDLRTTFQTRLTECNIPDTVIGLVMGNSIGALKRAYTDVSDEYLIREFRNYKY